MGDYINNVVTVKESDISSVNSLSVINNALFQISTTGTLNTANGSVITDLDNWNVKGQGQPAVAGPDTPYSYDHIMYIVRNYHLFMEGSGFLSPNSSGLLLGYNSDAYSFFNGANALPFSIIRHEYDHLLFGSNTFPMS